MYLWYGNKKSDQIRYLKLLNKQASANHLLSLDVNNKNIMKKWRQVDISEDHNNVNNSKIHQQTRLTS